MRAVRHGLVVTQARPGGHNHLGRTQAMLLGLGILQIVLGCAVVSVSFAALALTTYSRVRNACPYWAGFAAMLSGGVGLIAWKQQTSLAVSFFTFLSAVCVLLHLVAAILSGQSTTLLASMDGSCVSQGLGKSCQCLLGGMTDCTGIQTLLLELMSATCGTSVVSCLVSAMSVAVGGVHFIKRGDHQRMLYGHSLASPVLPTDSLRTPMEDEMLAINMVQPVPPPPYSPPGCYISQHGILSEDPPPYSAVDPMARITEVDTRWTTEAQSSVDAAARLSPSVEGACGTQAVAHSMLAVSHSGTLNNMLDSLQLASNFTTGQTSPNNKEGGTCESAELQRAVDMSLESVLQAFHEQTQQMDRRTDTNIRPEPTRNFRLVPQFSLPDATPSPQGAVGIAALQRDISEANLSHHGSRISKNVKDKTQETSVSIDSRVQRRQEEPLREVLPHGIQDSHTEGSISRKSKPERPKTLNLSGNAKLRKQTHRNHKKRPRSLVDSKDLRDTKVLVAQFLEQPVGNLPPAVQIVVENIKSVIQSDERHLAEVMHSASVLQEVEVRHNSTYRYSLSSTSSSSHVSSSGSVYRTVEVSSSTVCRTADVSPPSRTADAVHRTAEGQGCLETAEDIYRETVL